MRIAGGAARPRRRMNLTPMIDVVFLLLVFFMMVSRFGGLQGLALALAPALAPALGGPADDQSAVWSGPPRLVEVRPGGLTLNGVALDPALLVRALAGLMTLPSDPVVLRSRDGAAVQDVVAVLDLLHAAGLTRLALVQ